MPQQSHARAGRHFNILMPLCVVCRPRMSEVVRFLQKIAALEEGQSTPLPTREGAPRYSLLNLMDAAAQVPPLSGSSVVLIPIPLDYPPWATPGDTPPPLPFWIFTITDQLLMRAMLFFTAAS